MDDLVAFLAARLDEDEAAAKAVEDNSAPWDGQWQPRERYALETYNGWVLATAGSGGAGDFRPGVVEHIARHDPARVLREVGARRAVVRRCRARMNEPDAYPNGLVSPRALLARQVLMDLAAAYSDHPGYRPEWNP